MKKAKKSATIYAISKKERGYFMKNEKMEKINNFINENFIDSDTEAYNNLEKLINFVTSKNYNFATADDSYDLELLIDNNQLFKNMLDILCVKENIKKLKTLKLDFIAKLIEAYETYSVTNKLDDENLEELEFYSSVDEMDPVALYIKSLPSKLLSREEVNELYKKIENGDHEAFNEIITHNLRLVISVAKKYQNRGSELLDLIQAGNEGLIRAAEKYDYKLGWAFSTYARWWIRQAIVRSIANESRNIRIPVHTFDLFLKIKKYNYDFFKLYNRYPNEEDIAAGLNIKESIVVECLNNMNDTLSLNQKVAGAGVDDSESEFQEFITDDSTIENDPDKVIFEQEFNFALNNLTNLTKRELEVIKYRFGFWGKVYTLEEIGQIYGVTRERIRQIESKATRKLKKNRNIQKFR